MLGFRARATGNLEITVDAEEIAEANWFSRDELRAAVASGEIELPPRGFDRAPDHRVLVRRGTSRRRQRLAPLAVRC